MKAIIFLLVHIILPFPTLANSDDEEIFTDYCQTGLCKYVGGDGAHTGCKNNIPHDGQFQVPPCKDAALMPLTESDKQDILDFHNTQRNFVACGGLYEEYKLGPGCRHGVVTWDKELEKTAYLHTSYCTFAHDKCRNTLKYPFSGQNLGLLTFNKNPDNATSYINVITYLWYLEYIYTNMRMINSYYHQTERMVGHFLTSLNERNNRIGCTLARFFDHERKKNVVMLSCNYPTTNIAKSTIYNSCKKPASKCVTGTDPKYKFLCSSQEKYDVSGKLAHEPYDGTDTDVFDNCGRLPEFFHYGREGSDVVRKMHKATYPDKEIPDESSTKEKPKTTAKPIKPGTTKKPIGEGNPGAGGSSDYTEDEYDDPDNCAVLFWEGKTYVGILVSLHFFHMIWQKTSY